MTTEFEEAIAELLRVQQEVADALARGAVLAAKVKHDLPDEILQPLSAEPLDVLLRELVMYRDQAVEDRAQIARLVVLIDRLNLRLG